MKILGIDPGVATTGWGVIEQVKSPASTRGRLSTRGGQKLKVKSCGCILTSKKCSQAERLLLIAKEIQKIIKMHQPDIVAIEKLFFSKNLKTAMAVSEARGAILTACASKGLPIYEFTPLEVKMAITGYGRAEKKQIQKMVKTILGLKDQPKQDDLADALACAICCSNSLKMRTLRHANLK